MTRIIVLLKNNLMRFIGVTLPIFKINTPTYYEKEIKKLCYVIKENKGNQEWTINIKSPKLI